MKHCKVNLCYTYCYKIGGHEITINVKVQSHRNVNFTHAYMHVFVFRNRERLTVVLLWLFRFGDAGVSSVEAE